KPAKRFADVSLWHPPVPDIPLAVLEDKVVNRTLREYPHLFAVVTPVRVERFAELLQDHPNQPFVQSVVRALREGFWPYADAKPPSYPDTWDERRPGRLDDDAAAFLQAQRDEEVALGRYSAAFGPDLLPGMYCMPVHVVPKPHSAKLRLVNDQSAGAYSLNSMIRPESIKGAVLDGVPALGDSLRRFRAVHGDAPLIMWKSDVSQAYRRMPVAPHWQIRQVVSIGQDRHVDRCNLFGGRGSLRVFSAFNALLSWVAEEKFAVKHKHNYVDDDYGFALFGDVEWYPPYQRYLPTPQARLLKCWDHVGVPHDANKQLAGPSLPIIGFLVDPNSMTVTLTSDGKQRLLDALDDFCDLSPGNRRRSLATFQAFAGYANWAFNVFPLLKPALSNIYDKMQGKSDKHAGIYVNSAIVCDLRWMRQHVALSSGVHMLSAEAWSPADLTQDNPQHEFALTDASGRGLGIYFPWLRLGLHCELPTDAPVGTIFFFEALAVCAAIHRARIWKRAGRSIRRLAVLSDNSNSVAIFNSLRASPAYNTILTSAVDVMLDCALDIRVEHIPGASNIVADALSRGKLDLVKQLVPGIDILPFTPPQDALGAVRQ
ncbi:hypothetical protein GY45DRAFT_1264713, partial [Cubamyces sp. BRFM 1775]